MPNLAFHFEVLNQVIDQLASQGDPRATVLKKNKPFAVLGALGPDLLRYLPVSATLANDLAKLAQTNPPGQISSLPVDELSELFLSPLGAAYSVLFRLLVVPTWPVLNTIKAFLDKADTVAKDEDLLGAVGIVGQAQDIQKQSSALKSQLPGVVTSVTAVIGQIIALPPWMEQTLAVPVAPSDPKGNRLSEFLRWHHTGEFARNLVKGATTDRQMAFALGYLCHVAASVTAEPFVNNVTGGPYRTHWWRNRLVSNFIDSWTFGFFESHAHMNGDEPTPPYASWPPLCSANLQEQFNVGALAGSVDDVPDAVKAMASGNLGSLPNQFPSEIATLLEAAAKATYPSATQPIAGFAADTFKQAFVGSFAVHWFMTSGSGPMCDNPIGAPPTTCTTAPTWISSGSTPSPQQAGLNTGGAVCGLLLAILALLELLFGDFPAGVASLIAAFNAPIVDWETVRCNLFWLRKGLVDAENGLRDALVKGGLAYPPPQKLGTIDTNGNTQPATDSTPSTGVPFCRSNNLSGEGADTFRYPHIMDATNPAAPAADLNFAAYPFTSGETPTTENFIPAGVYPDFVVNGAGLQNGGILVNGAYPSRYQFFGDAVSNAVQVIQKDGNGLPNYNLDADRGYGWKAWTPQAGTTPMTPPVLDVQET